MSLVNSFNSFLLCVHRLPCAGAYNACQGKTKRKNQVTLYARFCGSTSKHFCVGSYAGLPSIISRECTGEGTGIGLDGGRVCINCKNLRKKEGSSNPSKPLGSWGKVLSQCLERRERSVLTSSDLDDASSFSSTPNSHLGPAGLLLKNEAKAQVEYGIYMSKLNVRLKNKPYQTIGDNSVPGIRTMFNEAADVGCRH